ncbi:MAG TPA: DUF1127 domain-containing protein [Alphaproteobacteria bacterium]
MNGTCSPHPTFALALGRQARRAARPTAEDVLIRVADRIVSWHERARSRRALLALDDRALRDIGVDRATADWEGSRPFWQP